MKEFYKLINLMSLKLLTRIVALWYNNTEALNDILEAKEVKLNENENK